MTGILGRAYIFSDRNSDRISDRNGDWKSDQSRQLNLSYPVLPPHLTLSHQTLPPHPRNHSAAQGELEGLVNDLALVPGIATLVDKCNCYQMNKNPIQRYWSPQNWSWTKAMLEEIDNLIKK